MLRKGRIPAQGTMRWRNSSSDLRRLCGTPPLFGREHKILLVCLTRACAVSGSSTFCIDRAVFVPGDKNVALITTDKIGKEKAMALPGFTAEASVIPAMYRYQVETVFGSLGAVEILPMQELTTTPLRTPELLSPFPWRKQVHCCFRDRYGRPHCTYSYVPVWYDCDTVYNPLPCQICHPPPAFPF